ncbi:MULTISPECIES: ATP/GTP-binding protein [unclassified Streptomyces]|uniref:ATP/GTP-binding protein n=1 Tax=unclassified Streptomyces TaxID=2593676 RepID=UPI0035DCD4DF
MLRRATAAVGVLLAAALAPAAHAAGLGGGVCDTSGLLVTVCASDSTKAPGSSGAGTTPVGTGTGTGAGSSGGSSSPPPCTYELLDPQPPAEGMGWEGHTPDEGAVYSVACPSTGRYGVAFVPTGGAAPAPRIDPEVVARRAVASMRLDGPAVASPRSAGTYLVGMPMWMWATPSPRTFGPQAATATAGGVTVTATAKVSSVRWDMGDGTTVTCAGPGTPYRASYGKSPSPTCGHMYERASYGKPGERHAGRATATWTIEWSAPALGDAGTLTETRESAFTVRVVEMQALNTP